MVNETPLSLFRVAEVELVYRNRTRPEDRIRVVQSKTANDVLREHWDDNKLELVEQFKILLLDRSSRCLGVSDIATGGVHHCLIDAKLVFATALKARASQLILAHNHPSGNLQPSQNDIDLTKTLSNGAKLLDMKVIEHLILTRQGYYSFADNGLIP